MTLQIPSFEPARVLIAGDVMLDRYWYGLTSRVSPEAPVPVVKIEDVEERPGGAANVAVNIATLGGQARVLGVAGADETATVLETKLHRLGVTCELIRQPGQATITKLRVLSRNQQLLRLDFEDGFPGFDPALLHERFAARLPETDVVVLSDYGKGALRQIETCIERARAAGKPVLADPKGHEFNRYRGAALLTPNLAEFEAVAGPCRTEEELVAKGERMRRELNLDALLITRGEQGMTLLQDGAEPLHLAARAREVYDVTGAGDTVIATLAAGLAAGLNMPAATMLANLAAGIVVGKLGAASVTVSELRRALYAHDEPPRGVLDEEQLLQAVTDAKAHGETIVMTNGCFDVLHAGHVTYLEQAKRLGNRLIVAVNADESVRRLKGAGRPVNLLWQRMRVLAGLAAVDWVVPFHEDTPERLISAVQPDYLVKGGDNDPAHIPGNQSVWDAGGQVVVMDYIEGCSTTSTIARILNRPGAL
ncbi:MAG TPA: bifunctional D-glycero-beta-D-manno-heptose-7-phosphate kinase/D-glycero-beta-D-manno-heptose 1-phosphate adenylyltransferase HldE [Candidatus Competibacteraceae bacterium]|nr:bifunctional D-glycero-beta-D-manno-heptose-7-phosphate kinase/D-glycero-beta-D-manno-heptose 1-phosphate adenylyltransferase HldE [Candidatus Competibacteraceae bacterium]MCP5134471.1 bifunctional D-glycero-beta-D-manno-heptose-7-phosphate kinase/D-glycero-beta-D-manno-heptose 1-phosphate adenylyltransferase HldE [Gammaproteobacteria bacterium]HPF58492.1 bifunctional D-glycero-beta-D-manno-heptose-7-phosphate kinase/D-glycero-beta-D-manno-heptose 1-phosphate adenylyltransferase HldE [Candidat